MNSKHAKSPCCGEPIRRFGERRRQCTKCGRTWRVRLKKRGRKRKRATDIPAVKFLKRATPSLRMVATLRRRGREEIRRRLDRSLTALLDHSSDPSNLLPTDGPLIMIADAKWHWIKGKKWTIYVVMLRPVSSHEAVVFPPLVIPGHECLDGWMTAMASIPKKQINRVVALVSDGVLGLMSIAREHQWTVQRCTFHLLSQFQNYATTGHRSTHHAFAINLLRRVRTIVSTKDPRLLNMLQRYFRTLAQRSHSRGLRRVMRGLLRDLNEFRTYLRYPELNLPATSNAVESAIQRIGDLLYRTRGFKTSRSLKRWVRAVFIVHPTMVCNGKKSTK